jgi:hypothetical protein
MSSTAPNLQELLLQRVTKWTGRRVQNLVVDFEEGGVILRGLAKSFHVKQLAQHGVQELLPDTRLDNAIVVE